jgi:predicted transcriptional regulator YdeE
MKTYHLDQNVNVLCVKAKSFPEGIKEAFDTLQKLLPDSEGRVFYGISHGAPNGGIVYKAAVKESFEGEAEKYGCEALVIPQGDYLVETIMDWHQHIPSIGQTFSRLLADPRMDQNFPCVEWYKSNQELLCMVKINN